MKNVILLIYQTKTWCRKVQYKPTFEMLRLMFKWTDDFERNKNKYEDMLLLYKHKSIRVKTNKELQKKVLT